MKKNIVIVIAALIVVFAITYLGTIKEGWYLTCESGIETHYIYKTDMFGNKIGTRTKSFVLYSR